MEMSDMDGCEQPSLKLSLAPVPYLWSREALFEFYAAAADWPVDIVYLGEIVCAKRRAFTLDDWRVVGEQLQEAGKTVCLSTLTLIEAASEAGALRRLCEQSPFLLEANDYGAVQVLSQLDRAFVTGPAVNIYNQHTLTHLQGLGLKRFVLPVELGMETLRALTAAVPGVEAELMVWGRVPLAWSARCYTARAQDLPKDHCDLACAADPDGRMLRTRDGRDFLVINGTQVQSALTQNLAPWMDEVIAAGTAVLRIGPQSQGTDAVVRAFDELRRRPTAAAPLGALEDLALAGCCDGYWHGGAGFERFAGQDGG
jgi:O2-independent ubiquinone biosynthesis protein UbiV